MVFVRYADDLVIGFEQREDAERFLKEFRKRLANFALESIRKTRLIEFGPVCAGQSATAWRGKTGDVHVSWVHALLCDDIKGHFVVCIAGLYLSGCRRRFTPSRQKLRQRMHEPVNAVGAWLKRVVGGYYRYHAVPENQRALYRFRDRHCDPAADRCSPSQPAQQAELEAHSPDLRTMDTPSSGPASFS